MATAASAPPSSTWPRAAFHSERARTLLGGALEEASGAAEIAVLDLAEPDALAAAAKARERCEHTVGLLAQGAPEPPAGLFDVLVAFAPGAAAEGTPLVSAARPFDPARHNPIGFRQSEVAGLCCLVPRAASVDEVAEALPLLAEAARSEPVVVLAEPHQAPAALPPGVIAERPAEGPPEARIAALSERLGALDHPALHASEAERAGWLVRLAAAGVPVACEGLTEGLSELLGEELSEALRGGSVAELSDLDRRERRSVAGRRAVHRHHTRAELWRRLARAGGLPVPERPKVSVIFSTRRESWLEHGIGQITRQSYHPRELVVCLHGEEFSDGVERRLGELCRGEALRILWPDPALTLGEALNAGVEAASGELVTKMDDDDWYSRDHLYDLALAVEYSGAELVGKAAEFVYLEEIDVTIRQLTQDVDTRLAGGGMMMRREPLREAGGWPSLTRGEDLAIVRRFVEQGRGVHRLHPHGYILNRHGRDHTWRPYVDYFLFRSERQWRGLRFDQTAID